MTRLEYLNLSGLFRVAFFDHNDPGSDSVTKNLLNGDGHRRAGFSGTDYDYTLEFVEVVLATVRAQPGPVE